MLSRWQSTIVDAQGNVQPLANLTVRNEADQSLAKMWASPGTSQPLPDGMVQADGNGYAFFYARGGLYRITSVALGIDWRHVPLGELAGMDVADLGLGTAATRDVGTGANTVAAGNDSRITGAAQKSANLSDLTNAATARSNLGVPYASVAQAQALESDVVVITPKKLGDAMNAHVLGMGQSWQNVTAQRAKSTDYTNTTGRPIMVSVSTVYAATGFNVTRLLVSGVEVAFCDTQSTISRADCLQGIVPAGATYRFECGDRSIRNWSELR